MFYNNLYGEGNCLDRLKDCKETGDNAIVSRNPYPMSSIPYPFSYPNTREQSLSPILRTFRLWPSRAIYTYPPIATIP